MLDQIQDMLDMQEKLEVQIGGPDWREANHDYGLCIHMECAEVIDLIGWKHWKNIDHVPEYDKMAMELVDIWHFALAMYLQGNGTAAELYKVIATTQDKLEFGPREPHDIIRTMLGISYSAVLNRTFTVYDFFIALDYCALSFDSLYRLYVSKNVLNKFRQDNGYKEGTYLKNWGGQEDNDHLYELTIALGENFSTEQLLGALTFRYSLVTR